MKIGRNDRCPCGSGKKYKKCCINKTQEIKAAGSTLSAPLTNTPNITTRPTGDSFFAPPDKNTRHLIIHNLVNTSADKVLKVAGNILSNFRVKPKLQQMAPRLNISISRSAEPTIYIRFHSPDFIETVAINQAGGIFSPERSKFQMVALLALHCLVNLPQQDLLPKTPDNYICYKILTSLIDRHHPDAVNIKSIICCSPAWSTTQWAAMKANFAFTKIKKSKHNREQEEDLDFAGESRQVDETISRILYYWSIAPGGNNYQFPLTMIQYEYTDGIILPALENLAHPYSVLLPEPLLLNTPTHLPSDRNESRIAVGFFSKDTNHKDFRISLSANTYNTYNIAFALLQRAMTFSQTHNIPILLTPQTDYWKDRPGFPLKQIATLNSHRDYQWEVSLTTTAGDSDDAQRARQAPTTHAVISGHLKSDLMPSNKIQTPAHHLSNNHSIFDPRTGVLLFWDNNCQRQYFQQTFARGVTLQHNTPTSQVRGIVYDYFDFNHSMRQLEADLSYPKNPSSAIKWPLSTQVPATEIQTLIHFHSQTPDAVGIAFQIATIDGPFFLHHLPPPINSWLAGLNGGLKASIPNEAKMISHAKDKQIRQNDLKLLRHNGFYLFLLLNVLKAPPLNPTAVPDHDPEVKNLWADIVLQIQKTLFPTDAGQNPRPLNQMCSKSVADLIKKWLTQTQKQREILKSFFLVEAGKAYLLDLYNPAVKVVDLLCNEALKRFGTQALTKTSFRSKFNLLTPGVNPYFLGLQPYATTSSPKLLSPTPSFPNPLSPTPLSPTPLSPTPLSPTPLSPTPLSPTPLSPTPFSPTPSFPNPLSSNPSSASEFPASPTLLLPEARHDLFMSNPLPGISYYFDGHPVETLTANDFSTEFGLQSQTDNRINWFELHPKIFFKGREITPTEALAFARHQGIMEFAGKCYLVDAQQIPSLQWLDFFWARMANPQAKKTHRAPGHLEYHDMPRAQVLDVLALRMAGMPIKGDAKWEKICQEFDQLTTTPENNNQGNTGQANQLAGIFPTHQQIPLKTYQMQGVLWLHQLYALGLGGVLADDMGLGKTLQVLSFLELLRSQKRLGLSLIVLPTSLIYNWQAEIKKFTPQLAFTVYDTKLKPHYQTNWQPHDPLLVIATYGVLTENEAFFTAWNWDNVIFDEAQNLKNRAAKRARSAQQLHARFKLCLTGTPMENHYGDFYSLIDLVVPGSLGPYKDFMKIYSLNKTGNAPTNCHQRDIEFLKLKTKPLVLRRHKASILKELPPKQETVLTLPFEAEQEKIYRDIAISWNKKIRQSLDAKGEANCQIEMLTALLRLRQACSCPQILPQNTYDQPTPKMQHLLESVQELMKKNESVLVFTNFAASLEVMKAHLEKHDVPCLRIVGKMSRNARIKTLDAFQNASHSQVLLMTLKTGGVGLNLTKASYVFHMEPWWNPAAENQGTDRVYRLGQDKHVQVYRYIMEQSVEEKIELLKSRKSTAFDALFTETEDESELQAVHQFATANLKANAYSNHRLTQQDFEHLLQIPGR